MIWKEDRDSAYLLMLYIFMFLFFIGGFLWVISSLARVKYAAEIYSFYIIQIFTIFLIYLFIEKIRKTKHKLLNEIFGIILLFSGVFLFPIPFLMGFSAPEDARISVLHNIIFYYSLLVLCLGIIYRSVEIIYKNRRGENEIKNEK